MGGCKTCFAGPLKAILFIFQVGRATPASFKSAKGAV
jgi:hypothetical protein